MNFEEACAKARRKSAKTDKAIRVVYASGGQFDLIYHNEISGYEIWCTYKNGTCISVTPFGRN